MKLKHIANPIGGERLVNCVSTIAFAWAPNSRKLALCGEDRVIHIFDENGVTRDKFPARSSPTTGSAQGGGDGSRTVRVNPTFKIFDLAFSPDSTKIVTAQSDGMVYIYKIGEGFKEKKSVLNKLQQARPVVKIIWGNEMEIICSFLDGKLRHIPMAASTTRATKTKTFYDAKVPTVSLIESEKGSKVAAGFADGKIAVFSAGSGDSPSLKYTFKHSTAPYALVIAGDNILAGGSDRLVSVYAERGKLSKSFDYSRNGDRKNREFGGACVSPNGQYVLFGGAGRIRKYRFAPRKRVWVEDGVHDVENLRIIAGMEWTADGSKVALGTVNGSFHLFETTTKKKESDLYDIFHVSPAKVVINMKNSTQQVELVSKSQEEIFEVRVMGKEKFVVATTMETFIICDIETGLTSEIDWPEAEGPEKFYFDSPNVCIIFSPGYFTLIEYGEDQPVGTYRTELANPHVISVRINESFSSSFRESRQTNKKLAYLVDLRTITIVDLELSLTLGHTIHDSKIDWLELNEAGTKLLFRDIKLRLHLIDIETMVKTKILTNCSFVQWVPESDVAVGQSRTKLCIWYNINDLEHVAEIETKGVAFNVVKGDKKTFIQVRDGSSVSSIHLDESLIEFGAAMEIGDLVRAVIFLESTQSKSPEEKRVMWKQLQKKALELSDLAVYERAAAGCSDISKAKYIRDTLELARSAITENVPTNAIENEVQARISIMKNEVRNAELAFLENDDVESCLSMYESMHKWQDALRLAGQSSHAHLPNLIENFLSYLFQTGQEELAADFLDKGGNHQQAVSTFLECGIHTKAAKVIVAHFNQVQLEPGWVETITRGLLTSDFYPEAAEFLAAIGKKKEALDCYVKAKQFDHAVQICKEHFPHLVVKLEEEWGNAAFASRAFDEACIHFVESGHNHKAMTAAVEARQWDRAMSIAESIEDPSLVADEYLKLGQHFAKAGEYRKAEQCFYNVGRLQDSIDMYSEAELFDEAYRIAITDTKLKKPTERSFVAKADKFKEQGRYKTAENVLAAIGEINMIINMYAKRKMHADMLRVVEKYHPSHLESSRKHCAETLRKDGIYRTAEVYYIKGGDYKEAISMYQEIGQWEEALRVAREQGNAASTKQVIYNWASSLGGETGLRLLKRYDDVDGCVAFLCETKNFQFAFEIVKHASPNMKQKLHIAFAEYLIEHEEYKEAKDHFIEGNAAPRAIQMFLNLGMIEEALELTQEFGSKSEFQNILLGQARENFDHGNYEQFEASILRAEKVLIGIGMYKDNGMWPEAFRLCKEYAPTRLPELQNEYDSERSHRSGSDGSARPEEVGFYLEQAKEFEKIGEFRKSVECFLKLIPTDTINLGYIFQCWRHAGGLVIERLEMEDRPLMINKLASLFIKHKNFNEASSICAEAGMNYEALDALMEGGFWDDASSLAKEFGSEYEQFVMKRHTVVLQSTGRVDELSNVNLSAALELLAEKGEWDKCLHKARFNEEALHHYMGVYVQNLLTTSQDDEKIMKIYKEYGFPFVPAHFELFKRLAEFCFIKYDMHEYEKWMALRNICLPVAKKFGSEQMGSKLFIEFDRLLFILHLHAVRAACLNVATLESIPLKITIAFLRYTHILPPEKYFYVAGQFCRERKLNNMAFVFLNQYMDIREAIEDGKRETSEVDYSALIDTDIPNTIDLPQYTLISAALHDETRDWVLTASMDTKITQELDKDERGEYEGSLIGRHDGVSYQPCVVTGYPVFGPQVAFPPSDKCANKDSWNRLVVVAKGEKFEKVTEVYKFIVTWCGSNPNYSI